jgi:sucrose phosphorylase
VKNQVQLIAYADRLGGSISELTDLLGGPLHGLFGGVHLLPFFTPFDGADHGFDPTDHTTVDPRLGSWDDVAGLARAVDVTADLIVNHISSASQQFRDYLTYGDRSRYASMFLFYGTVFPGGAAETHLIRIYRPRPGLPFTTFTREDGVRRLAWTTFTAQQVDLDVRDPAVVEYFARILDVFAECGIVTVRLDAIGYAAKTAGTSCFMTPETYGFIEWLSDQVHRRGMAALVEVHAHYGRQLEVASRVDWVYDFALPPLVLNALFTGDTAPLSRWLTIRPSNAVTVLDTHDGIGVVDVGPDEIEPHEPGLLTVEEVGAVVERIHENTGGVSRRATGRRAGNLDIYQVNSTFYDALGRSDDAYLAARLIQLFAPGAPQIYYVGLLAGHNDVALFERTGVGRDVNRHGYTRSEIDAAMARPVVQRLMALIRFRNTFPAFDGEWSLPSADHGHVRMRWAAGDLFAELSVDARGPSYAVTYGDASSRHAATDLLDLPR